LERGLRSLCYNVAVLSRLYATNYRCLVNFEFKPTTKQLIIGRNGTGKTAVLDVLAMLRDFAVRGKPCEGYLGGKTRTRWQNVAEQRFELDVACKEGKYHYTLSVDEDGVRRTPLSNKSVSTSTLPPCFASKKGSLAYSIRRNLP